jgi:colanic acid biosynthesis glycosyl transferase WcaI
MRAATTAPVRVCFFNRSYWPDTGATGQLLTELAEDLAAVHGMQVTVITGHPLDGDASAVEMRNGVRVIRARGTTLSPRRFTGRALNYLTYFLSAWWVGRTLPRQDVTVALTDPPIIGLAALAARPRGGMIFFCQDVFPEVAALLEDFQSATVNHLLERINRYLIASAAQVVALGDTMAARLIEGKGAEPSRVTVIHNWADTSAIVPSEKDNAFAREHGLDGRFVVLHAGNIGLSQNLDVVIEAAARLVDRRDILFLFIGDGNRRELLQRAVQAQRLDNVRFLPFQPREQLRWTYASSDLCLISLKPGLAGYIVPSKLYPILAAGRPYIAAVDEHTEVAALTHQHLSGVVIAPGDANALAETVARLSNAPAELAAMGERSRRASEHFSRDRQVAAHAAVIRAVAQCT